jgi:hypothetical protein
MSAFSAWTVRWAAAPEQLVGELGEPALDEVQPAAAGRGEVQVKARAGGQPALDLLRLVGRAVIEHDATIATGCGTHQPTPGTLGARPTGAEAIVARPGSGPSVARDGHTRAAHPRRAATTAAAAPSARTVPPTPKRAIAHSIRATITPLERLLTLTRDSTGVAQVVTAASHRVHLLGDEAKHTPDLYTLAPLLNGTAERLATLAQALTDHRASRLTLIDARLALQTLTQRAASLPPPRTQPRRHAHR